MLEIRIVRGRNFTAAESWAGTSAGNRHRIHRTALVAGRRCGWQDHFLGRHSGSSLADTCLLAKRCPVYRRRDSSPGFRRELENLACDGKGKGTSGRTVRLKVPMRRPGADCSVVVTKRGNARGARGAGHLHRDRKGQRATVRTRWFRLKAAAFNRWHEPDESRDSCPDL